MLYSLLAAGGPVMYILFCCSIIAVAIILERIAFWLREYRFISYTELRSILQQLGSQKDVSTESRPGTLCSLVVAEAQKNNLIAVSTLLQLESEQAYERSMRNLSGLDTIISIAPLLGILGTVLGIMKSFHALDLQHITSPGAVSHGLAEAMLTTAAGLAIAVPTLVCYNIFTSLARRHAVRLFTLGQKFSHHIDVNDSSPGSHYEPS
jgi:biopolymer transport protein ExbB